MRRASVSALLLVLLLVPGALGGSSAVRPLLGVTGDPARFQAQTGQISVVRSIFLGWGQGHTFGSRFARLFADFGPVPMIHLGTGGPRAGGEVITPLQIARGAGDAYLVALNGAIDAFDKLVYVRAMAEMNNPKALYSYERKKNAAHAPAAYKLAFCRIYVFLHGGPAAVVNARLRALGLPGYMQDLPINAYPLLRVIWNPVAGMGGHEKYYPGDPCTDIVGNDIYTLGSMGAMNELYNAHRRKKFSIPEWGLESKDDPALVEAICKFIKTHPRTELVAYYEAKLGSMYDLGNRPMSRAAYRRCITPLGGPTPG
jgi:hypothetical protein